MQVSAEETTIRQSVTRNRRGVRYPFLIATLRPCADSTRTIQPARRHRSSVSHQGNIPSHGQGSRQLAQSLLSAVGNDLPQTTATSSLPVSQYFATSAAIMIVAARTALLRVAASSNHSVNRTPCQLRWQVPSALRAPVAGYVERS